MKDEDAFNADLSTKFNKLSKFGVARLKLAEKYHIGVADFCLWKEGRSVVVECKFLRTLGAAAGKGMVLKHEFTGPQQTFLQTLMRAHVPAFGLIGVDDVRQMILIPANLIPKSGNWSVNGLVSIIGHEAPVFDFKQVPDLVSALFSYRVEGGICRRP